ncbi:coproporphyrinogen III oxidase [Pasteurellaceae bacterium Macca]|nr:coproporphyrinogen III oxidase [Pasteurellaceae bacterium Macca]MCK3656055.1 coproporphyrinogen III oxidase [Pasteurellaceae bacterium Macca]
MVRFFLIILAILIVLSMAFYALSLFIKIRHQHKAQQQAQHARFLNVIESIEIIAKAMATEQCGFSEGVLRLKPLLDILGQKLSRFPALWALFEVVETMPILEARQSLKRNERMKLDLEREAKEAELASEMQAELVRLQTEMADLRQQLQNKMK